MSAPFRCFFPLAERELPRGTANAWVGADERALQVMASLDEARDALAVNRLLRDPRRPGDGLGASAKRLEHLLIHLVIRCSVQ